MNNLKQNHCSTFCYPNVGYTLTEHIITSSHISEIVPNGSNVT